MVGRREDTVPAAVRHHETLSFSIKEDRDSRFMEGTCSCAWGLVLLMPHDDFTYQAALRYMRSHMAGQWQLHIERDHPDYTTEPEPEEETLDPPVRDDGA